MAKISENVYIDDKKKVVRVVIDDATDSEMKMVDSYVKAGYTLKPKKKSSRKGDSRTKEDLVALITDAKEKKEFESICKTKGKGFLAAKKWLFEIHPELKESK